MIDIEKIMKIIDTQCKANNINYNFELDMGGLTVRLVCETDIGGCSFSFTELKEVRCAETLILYRLNATFNKMGIFKDSQK